MSGPKLKNRVSGRSKNSKSKHSSADPDSMLVPFVVAFVAFLAYLYLHYEHVPVSDARADLEQWFVAQGGWMSPHLSLVSSLEYHGHGLVVKGEQSSGNEVIIEHEEKILEIPTKLLFTMEKSKKIFMSEKVNEAIQKLISDPLDQQDVWIAMDLMLQCSKGNSSEFYPYMTLLPADVPRLVTFTWEELDLLQDEDLSGLAKVQAQFLQLAWKNGVGSALLKAAAGGDKKCQTLDAFKLYVNLSASRAMILDDVKYLTPMADMINHADRPLSSKDAAEKASASASSRNFQSYHELQGDTLVVRADRNFSAGDVIVEEYGKLDNSLYVTAFGFVPMDNPHHCAVLPLPAVVAATDDNISNNRHPGATVCVRRDGTLNHPQEESMLTMAVLSPDCTSKKDCQSHPEQKARVKSYIQKVAQERLDAVQTTFEQDEAFLLELEDWKDFRNIREEVRKDQALIALQFRMEEKRLLKQLTKI